MKISEQKIEEVRSAINIVDIISDKVNLRKRGKNFLGLCPFHNEKTPSFTVSDEKQIYHCFGCHSGGNVFKFLMEYEKISFVESVQELAQQAGIDLDINDEASEERQSEQENLYDINSLAGRYFSDNLRLSDEGELARNYFEKRNLKDKTIREFGLGYSFPSRDGLVKFLSEKKVDLERALQLGLIGKANDGRLYDRFSGRIIFPIFSPHGRVIAFAGRILENRENAAKYLNSPESIIYYKGKILYGLSHAKDEIRKQNKVILVEGYMDLISLYQNGIKNVVAVSGTALTEDQVQLLSRYTKNVFLLFDSDAAGIKASMRSIELLLKKDIEIKIIALPSGEDPDSYVNKFGRDKFEALVEKAQNFLEYQTAYYESNGMFSDSTKTAEAIRELVKPISLINDELKRSLLIKSIAKKFNLREKLIEQELQKQINTFERQNIAEVKSMEERLEKKEIIKPKTASPVLYNLEKEIIKLLFEGNEKIIQFTKQYIFPEDFSIAIHTEMADMVYNSYEEDEDINSAALISKIKDEEKESYIREITFDKYSISKNWEDLSGAPDDEKILLKVAVDSVKKFKEILLDQKINANITNMETAATDEERMEIMKMNRELKNQKTEITGIVLV